MRAGVGRVSGEHHIRQVEYILGWGLVINGKDFEIEGGVVLLGLRG